MSYDLMVLEKSKAQRRKGLLSWYREQTEQVENLVDWADMEL